MEYSSLQTIWFILTAILFTIYAIFDGFDLGVGIIHLFLKSEDERRLNMNSVGPFWDGNEVWLIAGGGALFAAFPPVYAAVWSGFYVAFILLLVALTARALAFEYRTKMTTESGKRVCDFCFDLGSLFAALLLGVAWGNILSGVPIDTNGEFVGTFWTLLNPYAILVGLLTLLLFTLQGMLWLMMKVEGLSAYELPKRAQVLLRIIVVLYFLTSILTMWINPSLFVVVWTWLTLT